MEITRTASNRGAAPVQPKTSQYATAGTDSLANPTVVELELQSTVVPARTSASQRWNQPRQNLYRFLSCLLAFLVMGMNDGVYGALIPYLETYYDVSYTVVSLIFLAPFVGCLGAAISNNFIHQRFGQRGIALLAPPVQIVAFAVLCNHPPYPVLPIAMLLAGFAGSLEDAAWNAWIGNMERANELLGILHGCYGLGATVSPLIATTMITKGGFGWYSVFYVMVGISCLEMVISVASFWTADAASYHASHSAHSTKTGTMKEALKSRVTWICAFFLICYVGLEVSFGGWLVTFMLRVRGGEPFASGMTVTGFWLGITVGRIVLGFVTAAIGEKRAIFCYLIISIAIELLFWLIPSFISSAIFAAFLGVFLGPLFPAAIVAATKLIPPYLHVSAIGFASAFGSCGAAVFPFAVGAIAQSQGVQVLQPIALALLVVCLGLWCSLPGGFGRHGLERAQVEMAEGRYESRGRRWIRTALPGFKAP